MTTERASFPQVTVHLARPPMPSADLVPLKPMPVGVVDVVAGLRVQAFESSYLRDLAAAFTECADKLDAEPPAQDRPFKVGDRVRICDAPTTASGGYVSDKAAGQVGVVRGTAGDNVTVSVRGRSGPLQQNIAPKHLTLVTDTTAEVSA